MISCKLMFKIVLLGLLIIIGHAGNIFAVETGIILTRDDLGKEISTLAEEYRELRIQPSHWKDGEWNDDVDRFGGRMHVLLQELGNKIIDAGCTKSQLVSLMGTPDDLQQKENEEILVYFWRGWHDYLYFVCEDEKILSSGWYLAYE